MEKNHLNRKNTLIIGAGEAAQLLIYHLMKKKQKLLTPIAVVDDNPNLIGEQVEGIKIVGKINELTRVCYQYQIEHIIIAIPSLNASRKKEIVNQCSNTSIQTEILPDIDSAIWGRTPIINKEKIDYSDLLDREENILDYNAVKSELKNKSILITGAGGSIGSEICRQLIRCKPKKIFLFGHGENSIYTIKNELEKSQSDIEVVPIIADIKDKERLQYVFSKYNPDIIYHAAAHKHVPLMEVNIQEAIQNNIIGTKNLVEIVEKLNLEKFIMISTDKAVNPTSVMGATKKIAEWIVQSKNNRNVKTIFSVVRFGNVLGSRGSAIPLFWEQIIEGKPVTLTHPEMERYFMTIPEASKLVIEASLLAKRGEVFILNMGNPQKLKDVIKKMINMSGKTTSDVMIQYIGLRDGEKLSEELFEEEEWENSIKKMNRFYYGITKIPININEIEKWLEKIKFMSDIKAKKSLLNITNSKGKIKMERI